MEVALPRTHNIGLQGEFTENMCLYHLNAVYQWYRFIRHAWTSVDTKPRNIYGAKSC